jgi:heme-degrading monooxygenase HmoA
MFIAINRINVPKGKGESLEQRFGASEGLKGAAGVLGAESVAEETEEYMAVTRWETEEHFHAWTKSDAFKKAHSGGHHAQQGQGHGEHAHGHAAASGEKAHGCASKGTAAEHGAEKAAGASCGGAGKKAGMNAQASGYTVVLSKEPQLA